MDNYTIFTADEIIQACNGHWLVRPDAELEYKLFTFPLCYLQSDTILLHVCGRGWRKKAIDGCGQRGIGTNALIRRATPYNNVIIITSEEPTTDTNTPVILVNSTHEALFNIAEYQRNRFKGHVIGITGTAGKSSTRDMLAALLRNKGKTIASFGNWNTTEGIALGLANFSPQADYAVVEISGGAIKGMRGRTALDMVQHHDAIITSIGINLTARTPTATHVAEVKSKLFSSLPPGGRAYFASHIDQRDILLSASSNHIQRIVGAPGKSNLSVERILTELEGTRLRICIDSRFSEINSKLIGPGQIANFSLAAQVALDLGVDDASIINTAESINLAKRKMHVSETTVAGKRVKFLDDCHNATLLAFENALGHIRTVDNLCENRLFVIGRIVHIEGQEECVYERLGQLIASCNPTLVILLQEGLEALSQELLKSGLNVAFAQEPRDVVVLLGKAFKEDNFVFLKGSSRGTKIRQVSSLLHRYLGKHSKGLIAGIASNKWSEYEFNFLIEALDYYSEAIYIDSRDASINEESEFDYLTHGYGVFDTSRLDIIYNLGQDTATNALARKLERAGYELSSTYVAEETHKLKDGFNSKGISPDSVQKIESFSEVISFSSNNTSDIFRNFRLILVDSSIVCIYENIYLQASLIDNQKGRSKVIAVDEPTASRLSGHVLSRMSESLKKGIYGIDVCEDQDSRLYVTSITKRPKLSVLKKLFGLNLPAVAHERISSRPFKTGNCVPEEATASIVFLGDTNPGETYQLRNEELGKENILKTRRYGESFLEFASLVQSADYSIMNLEAVITNLRNSPLRGIKPYLDWTSPEKMPEIMKQLNIKAVNLANNHCLDFGEEALADMVQLLEDHNISHVGAELSDVTAGAPLVFYLKLGEKSQKIIMASGFEYRKNHVDWGYYATHDKGGVNLWSRENAADQIINIRSQHPDAFIIAFPHWGSNYSYKNERQEKLAYTLIDSGVDLIIGHGSHMMQEVELYNNRWIIYGIGNFIFNSPGRYRHFDIMPISLIPKLAFADNSFGTALRLELYPIYSDNLQCNYKPKYLNKRQFKNMIKRFFPFVGPQNDLIRKLSFGKNEFGYHIVLNGTFQR